MTVPRVVAALQAPTLLNILARSSAWSLKVCAMGDHDGLAETSELSAPMWKDGDPSPDIVLVCTPFHLMFAQAYWPDARIAWVVHNGRERSLLPTECEGAVDAVVVFSERLRWLCQAARAPRFHFISPAYEARSEWSWTANKLWSLRSRPDTRSDDRGNLIPAVVYGVPHSFYGQGQTAGFANESSKAALRRSCSAYVSALDRSAGFGLAEHEALAAGVPIVGGWWGDMEEELPVSYWGLQHSPRKMHEAAKRAASSKCGAEELSAIGLSYIAKWRTAVRMDETISEFITRL